MTPSDDGISTTDRTIQPGPVTRAGTKHEYRRLVEGAGEPHVVRDELIGNAPPEPTSEGRNIAHIAHVTDVQLIDHQSPGRLECLHALAPELTKGLIPMTRPQEMMGVHATEAVVQAVNVVGASVVTGAPLALVLSTGDSIDNAQRNELDNYLALFSGGTVHPDSGGPEYEGFQDGRMPWAWAPEVADHPYARAFGFPTVPGLLDAARKVFHAEGLAQPWLTAFGNHDGEIQGRSPVTSELTEILTGDRKVYSTPEGVLPDVAMAFSKFFSGDSVIVTADPARRPITRSEYVSAHLGDNGTPHGHGYTQRNSDDGTGYYVYDGLPGVRVITLDTTNTDGYPNGSIGARQLAWLHERLTEVNPRYLDADGRWTAGGDDDRIVIVASHHSRELMNNPFAAPSPADAGAADRPKFTGETVQEALHRYPNVVAWLNGHIHMHIVEPRPGPAGGYWEITTGSVLEWPSQARLLEIIDREDGTLSLWSTVVDHVGAVQPHGVDGVADLAGWHRELSANDLTGVQGLAGSGRRIDRNVDLRIPDPRMFTS